MSIRGVDSSSPSPRLVAKSLNGIGLPRHFYHSTTPSAASTATSTGTSTLSTGSTESETRTISRSSIGGSSNSSSPLTHFHSLGVSKENSPATFTRSLLGSHLLPSHLSSYSPPSASPGVGVRRLAEQFLNSITDDSPAVRPRRIGLGKHTTLVTPSVHVPTQTAELERFASTKRDLPVLAEDERKSPIDDVRPKPDLIPKPVSTHATVAVTSSAPSLLHPNTPSVTQAPDDFEQLHDDILAFSNSCAEDTQNQKRLREELVQRTQWSIRCVWPTAQVDLVGSVAAGVCLPKSDLDFVVWFQPSKDPPPSYSYATTPANQQGQGTATSYTYTTAARPPVVEELEGGVAPPASSSPELVQHFSHAGSLIKLIGGRKKSKLLFRSTKIQVFKDINLIRLRDGCSGISMDLWFPVDPAMLTRSQQHTMLIQKMQADFPVSFYPLAIVLKSFMSQNLLNSGYSGLGSYGVLLMLIRFLQYERFHASKENREEETNLGKLLVGFFRLYATFDYIHHAIDVVNLGPDGDFLSKPPVIIVKRVKRPVVAAKKAAPHSNGARRKKGGEESDEEDESMEHHAEESEDDALEPQEERESASLKKKRSNAADRFTLLILDPMDSQNQIICHHKALRNMIGAFIRAIMILDPDNPAPPLMLPATPADPATGMVPALSAPGPAANAADAAQPISAPNTPPLVPQAIQSLPPYPGLAATAHNTNTTRFHRLIEVNAARLGPQTKPCPSAQCQLMDGSSKTLCPIQNKVCFTCGHLFVKPNTAPPTLPGGVGVGAAAETRVTQPPATLAPKPTHTISMKGPSTTIGVTGSHSRHAAGQLPVQQQQVGGQSQANHRAPPMQGPHQRNYANHNQRAQTNMQPQQQQQQQQQVYSAQTMLAAQQLLAAQLSSQNAASTSPTPLMFYNLNTNQMEPFQPAMTLGGNQSGMQGTPLGFIPVMAYTPTYATSADPQAQQMATMTALMQQMQVANVQQQQQQQVQQQQHQQQQQPQFSTFLPQSTLASMYGGSSNGSSDLSAYLAPSYVAPLTYDYSPTYPTRTLSDTQPQSTQSASSSQLVLGQSSSPTNLRSNQNSIRGGGGGNNANINKGISSRANHNFNHQAMMQHQMNQQAAAAAQAQAQSNAFQMQYAQAQAQPYVFQ